MPPTPTLLERSQQALENGAIEEARRLAEEAYAPPASYPEAAELLGYILQVQGEHAEAVKVLSAAIQARPDCAECYNNRGLSNEQIGNLDGAEADLRQAIAVDPSFADAYYNLGVLRYMLDDYQDAAALLSQAVELAPQDSNAWLQLALARQRLDQPQDAIDALNRCIELSHGFVDQAYYMRGQLYAQVGEFAAAEVDFDTAIGKGLRNADTLYYRGLMRYYQDNLDGALVDLLEVVEGYEPDNAEAHYQLAYIYARLGDQDKAREHAQRAIDLDPPQVTSGD